MDEAADAILSGTFDASVLSSYTMTEIKDACSGVVELSRAAQRKREDLVNTVLSQDGSSRSRILQRLQRSSESRKRKRPISDRNERRIRIHQPPESIMPEDIVEQTSFMSLPSRSTVEAAIAGFIDRTGNDALKVVPCGACARETDVAGARLYDLDDIPSPHSLAPAQPHPSHSLSRGMLLYEQAISNTNDTYICSECERKLLAGVRPPLSLSNNMWIGDTPHELSVLTLPERILIALYFPAAYIVKLFPKVEGAQFWDKATMHSGIQGNVSTYPLDHSEIASMIDGKTMPPPIAILSAVIGVTFIGRKNLPEKTLPDMFLVRRDRVLRALVWLKNHNPLYRNILISDERLLELPINAVPNEILAATKYSSDVEALEKERESYVPQYNEPDIPEYSVGVAPAGIVNEDEMADVEPEEPFEPAVIPLTANGIVDAGADDVPDSDIAAHAFSNANTELPQRESFHIRRGSAFINEYARIDPVTGQRYDGGPSNANHMLGAFPVLFPYGVGGFEVGRPEAVPYETHARWALLYWDKRFRKDLHFVFQVFGIIQKRRVCRSASLQIKRSTFQAHENELRNLKPSDLLEASREEHRRVPFSNPAVQVLRTNLTAIRGRIPGTDESRTSIRSKIWGSTVMHNPPNLWITLNPPDTGDPIAQVMAGEEIDLDEFDSTIGPTARERAVNVANDPYASARYFHTVIRVILEELFGITVKHGHNITRKEGIMGMVNGYVGTVEAQGRGSLHLHLIMWLRDSPTSKEMKTALLSSAFREKVRSFIHANIRADMGEADTAAVLAVPVEKEISYSRPVDPRRDDYAERVQDKERALVRALQVHQCSRKRCLQIVGNRPVCKRRAPFPLSSKEYITTDGDWGPKRLCGAINNFCPAILNCLRGNHDVKLIMQGAETKDIMWYVSTYATKKQMISFNASALLAKRLAYHLAEEKRMHDILEANKRLIQRCANALSRQQEFSGPEVISHLMGWGDRYESHFYVNIYWDSAMSALKKQFPHLRRKRHLENVASEIGVEFEDGEAAAEEEPRERIEIQDGEIKLRDQLKDYQYRGEALANSNLLDFFLNTYERSGIEIQSDTSTEETSTGSRWNSERVPYLAASGKEKRCRIIRRPGHETMPNFIGQWFPRSDDPTVTELYSASMLMLLSPWRSLASLKERHETFHSCFQRFLETAPPRIQRILDNIQYFHECSDGAKRRASEGGVTNGGLLDIHMPEDHDEEPFPDYVDDNLHTEITEEDIERSRLAAEPPRERFFGAHAISNAIDAGIFSTDQSYSVYKDIASKATFEETKMFEDWTKTLKSVTRLGNLAAHSNTNPLENNPTNMDSTEAHISSTFQPSITRTISPPDDLESRISRERLKILNADQRRAYDIIEKQILARLRGEHPKQLLMLIQGQGGTGKSLLINTITKTFSELGISHRLAKTASSGVAASLIGGETSHGWAGIPIRPSGNGDWTEKGSKTSQAKRIQNIKDRMMLLHDEVSMTTKEILCLLSQAVGKAFTGEFNAGATKTFADELDVILFGDFHQFPPVKNPGGALYCDRPNTDKPRALIGREIYLQFEKVVILKEQNRIRDPIWNRILTHLRDGTCDADDLREVRKLVLTDKECNKPDFDTSEWSDTILVTSRHGVRSQWNSAALVKHCSMSGQRRYISQAEDTVGKTGEELPCRHQLVVVGMTTKNTGNLAERVDIAIGMKAMVLLNIATEADIANGTRGVIVDIMLDPRENMSGAGGDGTIHLQYPPALILFQPDIPPSVTFTGLPKGIIPITPTEATFQITTLDKTRMQIRRRQLAITPAYAFTDYKSQGQTIERVIVDLAKPPTGELTPFHAYVALSRSRGRDTIRLLRNFDEKLFTTHPSEDLRLEDIRLEKLDRNTTV
ncbi:ATP-dependent DNA helicase PIF1 [Hypsizygus marmoreus]|uniref:ATP-dependent DNA helicase n=1 Tax=Hypsizygus marmoreus TaxID=39966 RepID=A0A369K3S9_HYPMA|nr:ATP-dependent DNA helicase PIF1 [Hypsizygus marmoreus]